MLDASSTVLPTSIVVGRVPSTYMGDRMQGDRLTITYTVYNEQAGDETGVLLTTTLAPGVAFVGASQQPDRSGQDLAWSLGTIGGYGRASVTLTVSIAGPTALQLDTGARAYATLDAGAVSDSAPPLALRAGAVDASLLASTIDADATDPYIEKKAAELDYDPQAVFDFLHESIGYNSYVGSVRGSRGTLWSEAGNALDMASLGVALMRASGVPAEYVQGTLPRFNAQSLILSMFPASYRTVGAVVAGTEVADPANDARLLAEAQSHYWFRFDPGTGMKDADPLFPNAIVGRVYTTAAGTFREVPDDLREKTRITLEAELYGQADAAFGGSGFRTLTVLDRTFNDVELVGRPVTVGHFVSSQATGLGISTVTNTYSPYLRLGDVALPEPARGEVLPGLAYQEILTNFPLGSVVLTGLTLKFSFEGPQGAAESYAKTLVDRVGLPARQNGGPIRIAVPNAAGPSTITEQDSWTTNVLPAMQPVTTLGVYGAAMSRLQARMAEVLGPLGSIPDDGELDAEQAAAVQAARSILGEATTLSNESLGIIFAALADRALVDFQVGYGTAAYYARPRLIVTSTTGDAAALRSGIDLLRNDLTTVVRPGQSSLAAFYLEVGRGIYESILEGRVMQQAAADAPVSISQVLGALEGRGTLVMLRPDDMPALDQLSLSPVARARIMQALLAGKVVTTPSTMVTVDGAETVGWFETDAAGHTISVMEDGGHGAAIEWAMLQFSGLPHETIGNLIGVMQGFSLKTLQLIGEYLDRGRVGKPPVEDEVAGAIDDARGVVEAIMDALAPGEFDGGELVKTIAQALYDGITEGMEKGAEIAYMYFQMLGLSDPPLSPILIGLDSPLTSPPSRSVAEVAIVPGVAPGAVQGTIRPSLLSAMFEGELSWSGASQVRFSADSLRSGAAAVRSSDGAPIGVGEVALRGATFPSEVMISGDNRYAVTGKGTLGSYPGLLHGATVGIDWDAYDAIVTGTMTIVVTGVLTLDGVVLPAGTYVLTTARAELAGRGLSSSPDFADAVRLDVTDATLVFGPGTGSLGVGGRSLNSTKGIALTGFSGILDLIANADGSDSAALTGAAASVLTLAPSVLALTTDQNTAVAFDSGILASAAGAYILTAEAPAGWAVGVDDDGRISVKPAPGLQSGTYPVRVVAWSKANPGLVVQATVRVTVRPTARAMSLEVSADPLITVPFDGAQLPTAFNAVIRNLGPAAATYTLTFSGLPAGFTLLNSGTSVAIPAGGMGSLGFYIVPGATIPAPGTVVSFTVTAAGSLLSQSQVLTFVMPTVEAVTMSITPVAVASTPGAAATAVLTLRNAGNVAETVTLAARLPGGLTLAGLGDVTLGVGEVRTLTLVLTPSASTPLDTPLTATIIATYGPSGSPTVKELGVPVRVAAPGAAEARFSATAATELGQAALAARLADLAAAVTALSLEPTGAIARGQAIAALDAILRILPVDPYLAKLAGAIAADRDALAAGVGGADVLAALASLKGDVAAIGATLYAGRAHALTLALDPNQGQALPGVGVPYVISIRNVGTTATTYDFSVSGLPAGVTASFNRASVTLQPGEALFGGPDGVVLTLTSTAGAIVPTGFVVTATARGSAAISRDATGSLTVRDSFLQVTATTPSVSFTDAGGAVGVSARVLNITANPYTARVYYTATSPSGAVVFTSTPVDAGFTSLQGVVTLNLGGFSTAGFAEGAYTIRVYATDAAGASLLATPGQASFVVGSPVVASLTLSPTTVLADFSFAQTLTTTLDVRARASFAPPLTLAGFAASNAPGTSVALLGTLAYMSGPAGVTVFDVSDPSSPVALSVFGASEVTSGGLNVVRIAGDKLLIGSQNTLNTNYFNFLIYSLADPTAPALVSNTQFNYHFMSDMFVEGDVAYFPLSGVSTFVGVILTDQFGDFLAVDFGDPTAPRIADVLFNDRGAPDGGDHPQNAGEMVNGRYAYVVGTSSTGSASQDGLGRVLIVDTSDASSLSIAGTFDIPGTVHILDVAVTGTQAVVIGSTGGSSLTSGISTFKLSGHLILTVLDVSDPLSPRIMGSRFVTQDVFFTRGENLNGSGKVDLVDLGGGLYAVGGTKLDDQAVLLVVDARDPDRIVAGAVSTPGPVNAMTASGGFLYVSSADGLTIYEIGEVLGTPLTISVDVPVGTDVAYDPTSFNFSPSRVIHGAGFDTLVWVTSLGAATTDLTLTWKSMINPRVADLTAAVALGASVDFVSDGTPGRLELPGTFVNVPRADFIFAYPASRTVRPGESASYTLSIQKTNGLYNISVVGLPPGWVDVASTAVGQPNRYLDLPIVVRTDVYAAPGVYDFTVVVSDGTWTDSYQLKLVVQGDPVAPGIDVDSRGVDAVLIPSRAVVGVGTPAQYVVRLTNLGSAVASYTLAVEGLGPDVVAAFDPATVEIPPGAGNYRDVVLTLVGGSPGSTTFRVAVASTRSPGVGASVEGTLDVLPLGVRVAIAPASNVPGSPFQVVVTNVGGSRDTYSLGLAGAAALVASLEAGQVTLAPGESRTISIATTGVAFAVPGPLTLMVSATSTADPSVSSVAEADLAIAAVKGLTAAIERPVRTIAAPGSATFVLTVENTGNVEDAYEATIDGVSGVVEASLIGLEGLPSRSLPVFRLAGLSKGLILMRVDASTLGRGNVVVRIRSLTDPTRTATVVASLLALSASTTQLAVAPNPSTYGQDVVLTATVASPGGTTPEGTVEFRDAESGATLGTAALVGGTATLRASGLAVRTHAVIAEYSGESRFTGSTATATLTVVKVATTTRLSSSPAAPVLGGPVTLTAVVTAVAGVRSPGGTVRFSDSATNAVLGSATVENGVATLMGVELSAGAHTIVATYSGDASHEASSATLGWIVDTTPTTTRLTAEPPVAVFGEVVVLTATVATSTPGLAPAGVVVFFDSATGVSLGSAPLVAGVAVLSTNGLAVGSHVITATYQAGGGFAESASSLTVSVARIGTAIQVGANPEGPTSGRLVVLTGLVLPASGPPPAGTVTYVVDGRAMPPVALGVDGSATLPVGSLGAGVHTIVAAYSGDSSHEPSMATRSLTVARSATSVSLSVAPTSSVSGQAVSLVADVAVVGVLAGTVSFFDGATLLAEVGLGTDGRAVFTVSDLSPGEHNLRAVYNGDLDREAGSSASVAHLVAAAEPSGPRVTGVLRYGIHRMPTVLSLIFDRAVDRATAENLANYSIRDALGREHHLASAMYDPASFTVTLRPVNRLNLHLRYKLTVDGADPGGVTDEGGRLLDGDGDGRAGGDFVTFIRRENLAASSSGARAFQPKTGLGAVSPFQGRIISRVWRRLQR